MKVGDCLKRLESLSGRTIAKRRDPNLYRPADVTLQIPCVDKFSHATGWKPRYGFDESLAHLLNYWRRRTAAEKAAGAAA
jgi:nucleoside-diphosphate-sugar epimerase